MQEIIIPLLLITVVINIILSVIILSRGLRNSFNILFGFLSLGVAGWCVSIVGFYSRSYLLDIEWLAWTHSTALFTGLIVFLFSNIFPNKIFSGRLFYFSVLIPFCVMLFFLFLTDSIIAPPMEATTATYELKNGYPLYQLLVIFYFFGAYLLLLKQHENASQKSKDQIRLISIGLIISSSLALFTNLILPVFKIFEFTWVGPLFSVILVSAIFIAILKYHLFNIKVLVTELFSIIIITVLFVEIFIEESPTNILIKALILIAITIFSYLLIKGVYREVDSREKIESLADDLKTTNSKLRELDKQKSEFISIATHQIRAPLTAIKGYSSLLLEGSFGEIAQEKIREAINRIFQSANSLTFVVNDFLDVSRIEQGTMKFHFSRFDMKELIDEVIKESDPTAKRAGIKIYFNPPEASRFFVHADMGKMKQVIGNLIDNAIKYTPHGEVVVTIKRMGQKIRVTIKDTGIGMSKETIAVLFEKFSRAYNANKVNVLGTGLGLYVARQLVEAHKGKVWAESEGEGKGSSFIVELQTTE